MSRSKPAQHPPDIGDVWREDATDARVDVTDVFLRRGVPAVRVLLPGGWPQVLTADQLLSGYHRTMTVEEERAQREAAAAERKSRREAAEEAASE